MLKAGLLICNAARSVVVFPATVILPLGANSRVPSAEIDVIKTSNRNVREVKSLMLVLIQCLKRPFKVKSVSKIANDIKDSYMRILNDPCMLH